MKVELKVTLDIPDGEKLSEAEMRQALFDSLFNYATVCHLVDVTKWIVKRDKDDRFPADACQRIINNHKTWAAICESIDFEIAKQF